MKIINLNWHFPNLGSKHEYFYVSEIWCIAKLTEHQLIIGAFGIHVTSLKLLSEIEAFCEYALDIFRVPAKRV